MVRRAGPAFSLVVVLVLALAAEAQAGPRPKPVAPRDERNGEQALGNGDLDLPDPDRMRELVRVVDPPVEGCDREIPGIAFRCDSPADLRAVWERAVRDPDAARVQIMAFESTCMNKVAAPVLSCFRGLLDYTEGGFELRRLEEVDHDDPRGQIERAQAMSGRADVVSLPSTDNKHGFLKGGRLPDDWRAQVEQCKAALHDEYARVAPPYCAEIAQWKFAEYRPSDCGSKVSRTVRILIQDGRFAKWLSFDQVGGHYPEAQVEGVMPGSPSRVFVARYRDGESVDARAADYARTHSNGPQAPRPVPGSYDEESRLAMADMYRTLEQYGHFDNSHFSHLRTLAPPLHPGLACITCHGEAEQQAPGGATPLRNGFPPSLAPNKLHEIGFTGHRVWEKQMNFTPRYLEAVDQMARAKPEIRRQIEREFVDPATGQPWCDAMHLASGASEALRHLGRSAIDRAIMKDEVRSLLDAGEKNGRELAKWNQDWFANWIRGGKDCDFAAKVPPPPRPPAPPVGDPNLLAKPLAVPSAVLGVPKPFLRRPVTLDPVPGFRY